MARSCAPTRPPTAAGGGASPTLVGYYGAGIEEVSYKDIGKQGSVEHQLAGGWVGMNDKYWLVTIAPPKDQPTALALRDDKTGDKNRYSADYQGARRRWRRAQRST
jgi:YidC/Oxa1 family membrane protein insertase